MSCDKDGSGDKQQDVLTPVCVLVNAVTTQTWENQNSRIEKQVQCIEGHLVRQNNTTAYPDCSAAVLVDAEKKYFQYMKNGVCPKENVLATCQTKTGSIYLYRSDLNNDVDFFKLYCEHFLGEIK
jgi:hypothetical protein